MSEYTYDYLVFIGRFQPLHGGHLKVMETALKTAKHLIVLVGSSNSSRCPRNPFTFDERQRMIGRSLAKEYGVLIGDRVSIVPINDYPYNDDRWKAQIQRKVNNVISYTKSRPESAKVGLIGHAKDGSSYYLKMFPMWSSVNVPAHFAIYNATNVRNEYFGDSYWNSSEQPWIPESVATFLKNFKTQEDYLHLKAWYRYDRSYQELWKNTPYPVMMTCVDAVVVQSGHIALVRRKNHPGQGLLALPGGHVEVYETFKDAAIRELKEETRISDDKGEIPPAMLESFIDDTKTRMFDDPYRSSRARVITQAYLFVLPDRQKLFSLRGDDDAEKAEWYPIGSLRPEDMFEDHFHITDYLLGGGVLPDD